jgi:hypothetical protein
LTQQQNDAGVRPSGFFEATEFTAHLQQRSLRELRLDGPHFKADMPLPANPVFIRMNANLVETTDRHSHLQSIATLAAVLLRHANV